MFSWLTGGSALSNFGYELGDECANDYSVCTWWTLHEGKAKADSKPVSIFRFDKKKNENRLELAKNAYKRAKTLRHPSVLGWVDGLETDDMLLVVTERVRCLGTVLDELEPDENEVHMNSVAWGIFQMLKAIEFMSEGGGLQHGNVCIGSVYVTLSGDWALWNLDFVSVHGDHHCPLQTGAAIIPDKYKSPEFAKGSWTAIHGAPPSAIDVWMVGCLAHEVFNGPLSRAADLRNTSHLPKNFVSTYQKMLNANPTSRATASFLLKSPFFKNVHIETCLFLENIALKDSFERDNFYKSLPKVMDSLPPECCQYKLLPLLSNAVTMSGVGNWNLLAGMLKAGKHMSSAEFGEQIAPTVVRYFAANDRALRITLLQHLDEMIEGLPPALVDTKIFPSVCSGFTDTSPLLREETVKSMLLFVTKLSERTINDQMLKYFAKLQVDKEPGIRTNTTICLGKIASNLPAATRQSVLAPAFLRATRDPFAPGKIAGLMALCATLDFYTSQEVATKIVPAVSHLTIHADRKVRDQAFKSIKIFVARLEALSNGMTETVEEARKAAEERSGMLGWLSQKLLGNSGADPNSVNGDVRLEDAEKVMPVRKEDADAKKKSADAEAGVSTTSAATKSGAAAKRQAGGGADGAGGGARAANSVTRTTASKSNGSAATRKTGTGARGGALAPKTTGSMRLTASAAKEKEKLLVKKMLSDGWGDFDDDLDGDDDGIADSTTKGNPFKSTAPKKKSPYVGLSDDEHDDATQGKIGDGGGKSRVSQAATDWDIGAFDDDMDEDDGDDWNFTPSKTIN